MPETRDDEPTAAVKPAAAKAVGEQAKIDEAQHTADAATNAAHLAAQRDFYDEQARVEHGARGEEISPRRPLTAQAKAVAEASPEPATAHQTAAQRGFQSYRNSDAIRAAVIAGSQQHHGTAPDGLATDNAELVRQNEERDRQAIAAEAPVETAEPAPPQHAYQAYADQAPAVETLNSSDKLGPGTHGGQFLSAAQQGKVREAGAEDALAREPAQRGYAAYTAEPAVASILAQRQPQWFAPTHDDDNGQLQQSGEMARDAMSAKRNHATQQAALDASHIAAYSANAGDAIKADEAALDIPPQQSNDATAEAALDPALIAAHSANADSAAKADEAALDLGAVKMELVERNDSRIHNGSERGGDRGGAGR